MLNLEEIKRIIKKEKRRPLVIPVYKEIVVDTETPVSLFLKLAEKEKFAYLLESAETNLQWGRYSFLSFSPYLLFVSKNNKVSIIKNNCVEKFYISPFEKIKELLKKFSLPDDKRLINSLGRFFSGLVGYIGYENVHIIESSVERPKKDEFVDVPDIYLMFNKIVLIFDHFLNKLKILYLMILENNDADIKKIYNDAVVEIENIIRAIRTTISIGKDFDLDKNLVYNSELKQYQTNINKNEFIKIVKKAKEYIYKGDIIQVVLSRRLERYSNATGFDIYRALRIINPSPYMFYLKFNNLILIGSSPEILVRKECNVVETRPIAGTRPRGTTEEEDLFYEKELLNSEKENAEHVMLVDLARNDIGKVAKFGSITLPHFKIIEKFSHVMHIVSSVKGIIKDKIDCVDVLKACFPAGTVSGAPKVRAMQIISELEKETRGVYSGAVGYFSLTGNMDMAITIRTILWKDNKVYIQTGAGIVADSIPEKEYQETINKAKALLLAVKIAEHF